jgi:hypothetical protein
VEFGDNSERPLQQWLKPSVFAALWGLCFLILIIVTRNNGLRPPYKDLANYGVELTPLKNEIRGLSYTRKENNRPVYSVQFGNLRTENNDFGIFKTALHKVIKVQDLELAFYRYTPTQVVSTSTCDNSKPSGAIYASSGSVYPATLKTTANVCTIIETVQRLMRPPNGWRLAVDFSNASEILVKDFEYKMFCDGHLSFSVRSRRLIVSSDQPEVILRGHVTIKAANGSTLESNYVTWDVTDQYFTAKGGYVLNRDGARTMGRNMRVDDKLNVVGEQTDLLGVRSNENG